MILPYYNFWRGFMTRKQIYEQYLNSDHWANLRRIVFERDGYKCTRCKGNTILCGHHIRYRTDLYSCTPEDIETLCWDCHDKEHQKIAKRKGLFVRNWKQRKLIDEPWFSEALKLDLIGFRKAVQKHFFGSLKGRKRDKIYRRCGNLYANCFTLYYRKQQAAG